MVSPANSAAPSIRTLTNFDRDPLHQVRLLAALRSGDTTQLQPFLDAVDKAHESAGVSGNDEPPASAALMVHLAIRCASYETISILLRHRSLSPNACHPKESRVSPLHLAASLGRTDVVNLLLEQDDIDDSVKDAQNRSILDVATKDVRDVLLESRSVLQSQYLRLLHAYIASPRGTVAPSDSGLLPFLAKRRARSVDMTALDEGTGTTLLHEAVRRSDLRLLEVAIAGGADVFVRDRKGKSIYDLEKGHSKEQERVKAYLRQYTNRDTALINSSSLEPPNLKGYLTKYTNVAKGYNVRWFVLAEGVLSYYRHQDDENLACRGSISMRNAKLKVSSSDKLRFEVSSMPTRSSSSTQKWFMRAEHPAEVARWTQAIGRSIEWYMNSPATLSGSPLTSTGTMSPGRASITGRDSISMTYVVGGGSDSGSTRDAHVTDTRSIYANSWKPRKKSKHRAGLSAHHGSGSLDTMDHSADESGIDNGGNMDDAESTYSSRASAQSSEDKPPHDVSLGLQANSTQTQIELTAQLLDSLVISPTGGSPSNRASEIKTALQSSLGLVKSMFGEYTAMVKEREEWYAQRCERAVEKSAMWEDSLGIVVGESEGLERDLLRLREQKRDMKRTLRASMVIVDETNSRTIRAPRKPLPANPSGTTVPAEASQDAPPVPTPLPAVIISSPPGESPDTLPSIIKEARTDVDDEDEDDSADEFFDGIEAGTVPNMTINAPLLSPPAMDPVAQTLIDLDAYHGYSHPRERLPIASDNRPPVSLWAVLKGSIGKDLTKISFPVFFNEPTSMLQRMAEDMEFTECLDAAVAEPDPHKRIAFVAAFAMSNYSSTIGRIAKPFNPMLGETFEYCRLDRQYRYVSEQVSHHPPISACWAESPTWSYFGEVDAKNKFMGKSFEIRPTGVAHAELKIPTDYVDSTRFAAKYPKAPGKLGEGKSVEHFSWKKVTTNVSGFIVGSPTIDHYGDMTVVNHRTGDRCMLSFKPRGWRAATACEIKGHVVDTAGNITWEIAGRWSSQLVARRVGSGNGDLLPDVAVSSDEDNAPDQQEYLLLWRNTEKPKMPFNLTPFAITLNDCPETTLKPYLPPTDCRLRPDQRAFENGEYERANALKSELEEFQRATRKRRETGELPPHRPRWFEASTDNDTGERLWVPFRDGDILEYWSAREKVYRAGGGDKWPGVERIFGDIH